MSESVVRYDEIIDKTKGDFQKIAPLGVNFEAERGYAIQLLQNNEYLMKAAQQNGISLAQAMKNVAAIGLSLNPAKKQAYLIPRNVKVGNQWVTKVFLEPSYMGLCDIAIGIGAIAWVQAKCVYSSDVFCDNGPGEKPTHTYNAFDSFVKRGDFVGCYCVAKTRDGDFLTTTMNAEQIYSIRDRSEAYKRSKQGPWVSDFEEMAKKTVLRQAFKTWPKGEHMDRLEQAINLSNDNEGIEFVTAPQVGNYTVEQKKYFDSLISNSDSMGMFVFMSDLDHGVQTSLYNSFEKGTITKYKQIVTAMVKDGRDKALEVKKVVEDACQNGDDLGVKELLPDLSEEVTTWVLNSLDKEARGFVMMCAEDAA